MFIHKFLSKHISCITIDSIGGVRTTMTSKMQKHSNHTAVFGEITRGRPVMHMFCKWLQLGMHVFYIFNSNIKIKKFQHTLDQAFFGILINLVLACLMQTVRNLAASYSCSKSTPSACNWIATSTVSFSFLAQEIKKSTKLIAYDNDFLANEVVEVKRSLRLVAVSKFFSEILPQGLGKIITVVLRWWTLTAMKHVKIFLGHK